MCFEHSGVRNYFLYGFQSLREAFVYYYTTKIGDDLKFSGFFGVNNFYSYTKITQIKIFSLAPIKKRWTASVSWFNVGCKLTSILYSLNLTL